MKRVSWATWLSRWAMSNSNLPKLASSAPTSFLQCTPPSVLLVKSTFPQISSFSPFPPSPNQQLQQFLSHIFLLTSHPVLWVPALLIYTASFSSLVLGLTKETASPPSSKVRGSGKPWVPSLAIQTSQKYFSCQCSKPPVCWWQTFTSM